MFVIKGKEFRYTIQFSESEGEFPTYSIFTPTGQLFITGLGAAIENNSYECAITIPVNAPNSTPDNQWRISWTWSTVKKVMYFDVRDPNISDDEIYQRELFKFALPNKVYSGRLIIPERPEDVECALWQGNKLLTDLDPEDPEDHRLGTQLTVEIPADQMKIGELTLVWSTDIEDYYQIISVPPMTMLPTMNKIRFIIDRVLKKIEEPQVYLDSDLIASIYGGSEYINAWNPLTTWTIIDYPNSLNPFLVYAGAWVALNSQFMLESDLAFSYSGQSVSLDYDRTGPVEAEIGRMQEFITENLTKAKKTVLRGETQGVVGVTSSGLGPGIMEMRRNLRLIRRKG